MIEYEIVKIDKAVKETPGTWKNFEAKTGVNKRRIVTYIEKLNKWIEPLGLKIEVVKIDKPVS